MNKKHKIILIAVTSFFSLVILLGTPVADYSYSYFNLKQIFSQVACAYEGGTEGGCGNDAGPADPADPGDPGSGGDQGIGCVANVNQICESTPNLCGQTTQGTTGCDGSCGTATGYDENGFPLGWVEVSPPPDSQCPAPLPSTTGLIQGITLLDGVRAAPGQIRLDSGSFIPNTDPFSFHNLSSGVHAVTLNVASNLLPRFSVCLNNVDCHLSTAPIQGSIASVNVPAGGYADVWWELFTPPTVDIKVNGGDGPLTGPYEFSNVVTWKSERTVACTVLETYTNEKLQPYTSSAVYNNDAGWNRKPKESTYYTISCFDAHGRVVHDNVLVTVEQPGLICSANKQAPLVGESVTWTGSVTRVSGTPLISWIGTDNLTGSGLTTNKTYTTPGKKDATFRIITGTGSVKETNCFTNVQCPQGQTVGPTGICEPGCSDKVGQSCTSEANSCGMTNTGTIQCNNSCSAVSPSNSLCPVVDVCPNTPGIQTSSSECSVVVLPQCRDGINNDGDPFTDWNILPQLSDPGCSGPDDDNEGDEVDACPNLAGYQASASQCPQDPSPTCQDPNALNYNQPLPCRYPTSVSGRDLTARDLRVVGATPIRTGNRIQFRGDIFNQGSTAVSSSNRFNNKFQIDIGNNGTYDVYDSHWSYSEIVGGLGAGASKSVISPQWTAVPGTHKVRLCADLPRYGTTGTVDGGSVVESNELNNCSAPLTFDVLGSTECSDGIDNDNNDRIDCRAGDEDPGCFPGGKYGVGTCTPTDDDESSNQCSDGLDNDGDGKFDYPDDPGCSSSTDDDEADPIDVCPNAPGIQTSLPCPQVDLCPGVEGIQTSLPCIGGGVDVCPDVPGTQTSPPCSSGGVDYCPNIPGYQPSLPCTEGGGPTGGGSCTIGAYCGESLPNSCGITQASRVSSCSPYVCNDSPPSDDECVVDIEFNPLNEDDRSEELIRRAGNCTIDWSASNVERCEIRGALNFFCPTSGSNGNSCFFEAEGESRTVFGSVTIPNLLNSANFTVDCRNNNQSYETRVFACRINPSFIEI